MHHENEKMALFEALYREYLVPLKKYAYRIGVGYDDIEDMVHEAFIEYYKRYSLDLDHKVKLVLLIRILRSKWIDNRRQMRRREMLHLEDPDAEEEIMNLLLEGEIGIQLLDQEVIDRDIYWNVWKIVKSMKKDWRDVLILRVDDEISTILDEYSDGDLGLKKRSEQGSGTSTVPSATPQ